jgi:GH43 family beta-xylosidase
MRRRLVRHPSYRLITLAICWLAPVAAAFEPAQHFTNPIYEGADPWITQKDGRYYLCQSEGDLGISVWSSDRITDPGVKRIVWRPQSKTWNSAEIWAPELHWVRGRWYIYYAASNGRNENHRAGVLEAETDDPQGSYVDKGMLYTGDDIEGRTNNRWAIDATPVEIRGRLYLIWSGWHDHRDVQYLYIAPMENPWTVGGNRVRICDNDTYLWERVSEKPRERGLHEGPQVLQRDGKVFVTYSCSGSWQITYKLGLVWMDEKDDPLDPKSWKKLPEPVFKGDDRVLGVGHASFVRSPDGTQDWIVYHSKVSREEGWRRAVWAQPFTWTADGFPQFGKPAPAGEPIALPAGERRSTLGRTFVDTFDRTDLSQWRFFGYKRFIAVEDGWLLLGSRRTWGIRIEEGERESGVLFRVRQPALGYDAYHGYFAGLSPAGKVILGKSDGRQFTQLALADCPVKPATWHTLRVEARGPQVRVLVDGRPFIDAHDTDHPQGAVGVRVVDTRAGFDDFRIEAR